MRLRALSFDSPVLWLALVTFSNSRLCIWDSLQCCACLGGQRTGLLHLCDLFLLPPLRVCGGVLQFLHDSSDPQPQPVRDAKNCTAEVSTVAEKHTLHRDQAAERQHSFLESSPLCASCFRPCAEQVKGAHTMMLHRQYTMPASEKA